MLLNSISAFNSQGFHLYVKLSVDGNSISNTNVNELLNRLSGVAKEFFTVVSEHHYLFTPDGASGSYILSESHMNYHTYPEYGEIIIDIYSCNRNTDVKGLLKRLETDLEGTVVKQLLNYRD